MIAVSPFYTGGLILDVVKMRSICACPSVIPDQPDHACVHISLLNSNSESVPHHKSSIRRSSCFFNCVKTVPLEIYNLSPIPHDSTITTEQIVSQIPNNLIDRHSTHPAICGIVQPITLSQYGIPYLTSQPVSSFNNFSGKRMMA